MDAETAHERIAGVGKAVMRLGLTAVVRRMYRYTDPRLRTRVFGIDFPNPVGLAAGFDKDAELVSLLSALGFGFIEVGTVTPEPQSGNPRPRLFRLPEDMALINRMGLPGKGARWVAEQLRCAPHSAVIGVNISKNTATPNEGAIRDYERCFETLAPYADYVTVNVSSPNMPGLRQLQEKRALAILIGQLKRVSERVRRVPILVKIAPDMNNSALDDIVEVVEATHADGIIAVNTTILRENLKTSSEQIAAARGEGGLSGKPLAAPSAEIIRYLYKKSNGAIPIIGVGGVFTAEDAYEKIRAGASLVELYTGLIYEGPMLVKHINRGLAKLLERDGFASIKEVVGYEHRERHKQREPFISSNSFIR